MQEMHSLLLDKQNIDLAHVLYDFHTASIHLRLTDKKSEVESEREERHEFLKHHKFKMLVAENVVEQIEILSFVVRRSINLCYATIRTGFSSTHTHTLARTYKIQ